MTQPINSTTRFSRPMTPGRVLEHDAFRVSFPHGFLPVAAASLGFALLGSGQLRGDGFSLLLRAPAAAIPDGHQVAGGRADLAERELPIFF